MRHMPTKADLYDYMAEFETGVTKRMLADAFNLSSDDRREMRQMLKEMQNEGRIFRTRSGFWIAQPQNNEKADHGIAMRILTDEPLTAIPLNDDESEQNFKLPQEVQLLKRKQAVELIDPQARFRQLRKGDHILAFLRQTSSGNSQAKVITKLNKSHASFLAVYRELSEGGYLEPIKKGQRFEYQVKNDHKNGAEEGDLVKAEPIKANYNRSRSGTRQAKILKVLTLDRDPLALNEISLIEHDIPQEFDDNVLNEANKLGAVDKKKRTDMRHIPFVTIDGEDAKDFDDAVFAKVDSDNSKLFHVFVAIADVSWYVRPNTALNNNALERGNSVYLPGTVVPMLPEILSNGWCSLNPDEDRGALVCEIWVNQLGQMQEFKFHRALIRSQARLTYKQVHQYLKGDNEKLPQNQAVRDSINQLHSLWLLLNDARQKRGALALESNERKVILNEKSEITDIIRAPHYESHEIIEELMILANVAAAKQLEKSGFAKEKLCMYRVHDGPNNEKLNALNSLFQSLDISAVKFNDPKPAALNKILNQAKAKKVSFLISTAILRCQSQAQYSPDNIGHYGLALKEYCHFTSPIRRYPDLLVHRALVTACGLGEGGLGEYAQPFEELAEHCNMTERRAAFCERDTLDRLTAQFLAPHQGASFEAKVDGLNRAGIFIILEDSGASGFCPMSKLPLGRYIYDEALSAMIELQSRKAYRLGDEIIVKLMEVSPAAGSMIFQVDTPPSHHIAHPNKRSKKPDELKRNKRKIRKSKTKSRR